jgi:hypothetical protein
MTRSDLLGPLRAQRESAFTCTSIYQLGNDPDPRYTKVLITNAEVQGDKAVVQVRGFKGRARLELVREKGVWKIAM